MDLKQYTVEELINYLLKARDKKETIADETKTRLAKLEETMVLLESELLTRSKEDGVERYSTESATVYWTQLKGLKVTDWVAFFNQNNDNPDFFTKSPAKKVVIEAIENGEQIMGVEMTPGVMSLNLRKKGAKVE